MSGCRVLGFAQGRFEMLIFHWSSLVPPRTVTVGGSKQDLVMCAVILPSPFGHEHNSEFTECAHWIFISRVL